MFLSIGWKIFTSTLKLEECCYYQQDCLDYLDNDDKNKLILLDIPYIGSENTCSVTGYKYQPFHKKVADYIQNAEYSFLYYCRSQITYLTKLMLSISCK